MGSLFFAVRVFLGPLFQSGAQRISCSETYILMGLKLVGGKVLGTTTWDDRDYTSKLLVEKDL